MKAHTKKTVPIAADWAAQLAGAIGGNIKSGHPGPGWVTVQEYMASTGLSQSHAGRLLRQAAASGKILQCVRRFQAKITNFYKLK